MKKTFPYLRILGALPFTAGAVLIAFPFIPLTDDFGVAMVSSLPMQIGSVVLGLCMMAFAIYLAAPQAFQLRK